MKIVGTMRFLTVAAVASLTAAEDTAGSQCNICGADGVLGADIDGNLVTFQDPDQQIRNYKCSGLQRALDGGVFPADNSLFCSYIQTLVSSLGDTCDCTYPETPTTPTGGEDATTMMPTEETMDSNETTTATEVVTTMMPTEPTAATMMPTETAATMMPNETATMPPSDMASDMGTMETSNMTTDAPVTTGNETDMTGTTTDAPDMIDDTGIDTSRSSCEGACDTISSLEELAAVVASIDADGLVCLCPVDFRPDSLRYSCPDTEDTTASVLIAGGQEVTIDCVGPTADDACAFGCPQTVIDVDAGAKLSLMGNFVFTGGVSTSRVTIKTDGEVDMTGATFANNNVSNSNGGTGSGGAIENAGSLTLRSCLFDSNYASATGGAIFGTALSTTRITNSTFFANKAVEDGGAIYSSGFVYLQFNTFEGANAALSADGTVIGPVDEITLEGCENNGLPESKACPGSGGEDDTATEPPEADSSSSRVVSSLLALATAPILLLLC